MMKGPWVYISLHDTVVLWKTGLPAYMTEGTVVYISLHDTVVLGKTGLPAYMTEGTVGLYITS